MILAHLSPIDFRPARPVSRSYDRRMFSGGAPTEGETPYGRESRIMASIMARRSGSEQAVARRFTKATGVLRVPCIVRATPGHWSILTPGKTALYLGASREEARLAIEILAWEFQAGRA